MTSRMPPQETLQLLHPWGLMRRDLIIQFDGLVVNYGISNTIVLKIP